MEAILENFPPVSSRSTVGEVARVNSAVITIFGEYARKAHTLPDLLGEEAARTVLHLTPSLRIGALHAKSKSLPAVGSSAPRSPSARSARGARIPALWW